MTASSASPISFVVNVARLPAKGMPVTIDADEDQRQAMADAHGLLAVEKFVAELAVTSWKRSGVRVSGRVSAQIRQACIVTLEPVEERVDEAIEALFVPEGSRLAKPRLSKDGEMLLDAEGDDAPETFTGDSIDVGLVAEEFFVLGINPYPRKADAAWTAAPDEQQTGRVAAFDKLAELRKKL
jgi:hypothetical protein